MCSRLVQPARRGNSSGAATQRSALISGVEDELRCLHTSIACGSRAKIKWECELALVDTSKATKTVTRQERPLLSVVTDASRLINRTGLVRQLMPCKASCSSAARLRGGSRLRTVSHRPHTSAPKTSSPHPVRG